MPEISVKTLNEAIKNLSVESKKYSSFHLGYKGLDHFVLSTLMTGPSNDKCFYYVSHANKSVWADNFGDALRIVFLKNSGIYKFPDTRYSLHLDLTRLGRVADAAIYLNSLIKHVVKREHRKLCLDWMLGRNEDFPMWDFLMDEYQLDQGGG